MFLIIEGTGVSVSSSGEIRIHLLDRRDIKELFTHETSCFQGELRYPQSALQQLYPKINQLVRLYDSHSHVYSRPMKIDFIFDFSGATKRVPPAGLKNLQDPKTNIGLGQMTSGEARHYNIVMKSLLAVASANNSYAVSHDLVLKASGYGTSQLLDTWLEDLVDAGLITQEGNSLQITDALIFLALYTLKPN